MPPSGPERSGTSISRAYPENRMQAHGERQNSPAPNRSQSHSQKNVAHFPSGIMRKVRHQSSRSSTGRGQVTLEGKSRSSAARAWPSHEESSASSIGNSGARSDQIGMCSSMTGPSAITLDLRLATRPQGSSTARAAPFPLSTRPGVRTSTRARNNTHPSHSAHPSHQDAESAKRLCPNLIRTFNKAIAARTGQSWRTSQASFA